MSALQLQPIAFDEACILISRWHRHHRPPRGWKFGIACNDGQQIVGVITVGRPVARMLQDGWTLEVNRCAVDPARSAYEVTNRAAKTNVGNAASMLYATAWRAARALGYRRLLTYTLKDETGVSLVAAGWRVVGQTPGGSWSVPSRPRVDKHPLGAKTLWQIGEDAA